ncbi:MAG: sporulation protein [Bacillota bacterium]|nr:MAG: sporulation protein [Bacillota bacterium]
MPPFGVQFVLTFCLALGVVIGGALFGAIGGLITGYPGRTMWRLAAELRPWAVVAALGEDLATFWMLEQGVLRGQILDLGKQVLLLLAAFAGAHIGAVLVLAASGVRQ